MKHLLNTVRREIARMIDRRPTVRMGKVTSVDPRNWTAKVLIQPEGIETGWIPVGVLAVGNGWGFHVMPRTGDMVEVDFREGSWDSGQIGLRFFAGQNRPRNGADPGEFLIRHESGSLLRFEKTGGVRVEAVGELRMDATAKVLVYAPEVQLKTNTSSNTPRGLTLTGSMATIDGPLTVNGATTLNGALDVDGPEVFGGNLAVTGNITATGTITGGG